MSEMTENRDNPPANATESRANSDNESETSKLLKSMCRSSDKSGDWDKNADSWYINSREISKEIANFETENAIEWKYRNLYSMSTPNSYSAFWSPRHAVAIASHSFDYRNNLTLFATSAHRIWCLQARASPKNDRKTTAESTKLRSSELDFDLASTDKTTVESTNLEDAVEIGHCGGRNGRSQNREKAIIVRESKGRSHNLLRVPAGPKVDEKNPLCATEVSTDLLCINFAANLLQNKSDESAKESKSNLEIVREYLANYQESYGTPRGEYSFAALIRVMGQATGRSLLALFYIVVNITPIAQIFLYILRFLLDKMISIRNTNDCQQAIVKYAILGLQLLCIYVCLVFIFGFIVLPILKMAIAILAKIMLYD